MRTEHVNPSDEALSATLRQWKVGSALPPRFEEHVWLRIARAEASVSLWKTLWEWVNAMLARPSYAVGYVTVLLIAGLTTGYWQARVAKARADETLSSRYVQMVDPYQNGHLNP